MTLGADDEKRTRTVSLGSRRRCSILTSGFEDVRLRQLFVREWPPDPSAAQPIGHAAGTLGQGAALEMITVRLC